MGVFVSCVSKVFDGQVGYGSLSFFQDSPLLLYDFEWWCAEFLCFLLFSIDGWGMVPFVFLSVCKGGGVGFPFRPQ